MKQIRGFQANCILQLHPPAAVTCCALQADWGLVTAGTAHGLALLDYVKNKPIMVKCTLNPNGEYTYHIRLERVTIIVTQV